MASIAKYIRRLAKPSLSQRSSHHFIVTMLPNHWKKTVLPRYQTTGKIHCNRATKPLEKNSVTMLPNHLEKQCYHVTKPLEKTLLPCYQSAGKKTLLPCYQTTGKNSVTMLPNHWKKNIVTMLPNHWKKQCYHVTKPLENVTKPLNNESIVIILLNQME